MGYRQYFYEVDRSIVDGIRKCKTEEIVEECKNVINQIVETYCK